MPRKREFKYDHCKGRGGSYLRKPRSKEFCKPACRHQHNNRKRVNIVLDNLMTIGEAAQLKGRSYEQIRRLVRQGKLRSQRLFKRILVYRAEVEKL